MPYRGLFGTGWPPKPLRLYAIDADTGQPLDPNVGRKTYVTYYDIKKDKNGNKSVVAHKSVVGSVVGAAEVSDV